jgi:protein TonB
MYYTRKQKGANWVPGIVAVSLIHLGLGWAVLKFGGAEALKKVIEPIETKIVEQVEIEEELPPPPPETEIDILPPMTEVILPDFIPETTATNAVTEVVRTKEPTAPIPKEPPAPPKAAPPAPKAPPVKMGAAMPKNWKEPDYPRSSKKLEEQGTTTVRVCVDEKGSPVSSDVVKSSGFPDLDSATVEWSLGLRRYEPAKVDGKPLPRSCMLLPMEWKLEDE